MDDLRLNGETYGKIHEGLGEEHLEFFDTSLKIQSTTGFTGEMLEKEGGKKENLPVGPNDQITSWVMPKSYGQEDKARLDQICR